jgi:hypothetical protein
MFAQRRLDISFAAFLAALTVWNVVQFSLFSKPPSWPFEANIAQRIAALRLHGYYVRTVHSLCH